MHSIHRYSVPFVCVCLASVWYTVLYTVFEHVCACVSMSLYIAKRATEWYGIGANLPLHTHTRNQHLLCACLCVCVYERKRGAKERSEHNDFYRHTLLNTITIDWSISVSFSLSKIHISVMFIIKTQNFEIISTGTVYIYMGNAEYKNTELVEKLPWHRKMQAVSHFYNEFCANHRCNIWNLWNEKRSWQPLIQLTAQPSSSYGIGLAYFAWYFSVFIPMRSKLCKGESDWLSEWARERKRDCTCLCSVWMCARVLLSLESLNSSQQRAESIVSGVNWYADQNRRTAEQKGEKKRARESRKTSTSAEWRRHRYDTIHHIQRRPRHSQHRRMLLCIRTCISILCIHRIHYQHASARKQAIQRASKQASGHRQSQHRHGMVCNGKTLVFHVCFGQCAVVCR